MPTPPTEGESKDQFMGRCMSVMHKEAKDKPQDQQVAICFSMWRKAHPKDKSAKNPNASEEEAKKKKKKGGTY
jgi:hypothetical protein